MLNKNLLLKVTSLLAIGLMLNAPALALARGPEFNEDHSDNPSAVYGTGNTGALAMPASGMGSIDLINYDGGSDQLLVDFAGIDYVVPPSPQGGSGIWNHVQISLAPGTYNYTASVAGNDTVLNNTITVWAGKVTSLGFYTNLAEVKDGDKGSDDKRPEGVAAGIGEQHRLAHDSDDLLVGVADETAMAH